MMATSHISGLYVKSKCSVHLDADYVAAYDEAPAIFATEFEDLVSLVAQNVSLEIRPSAAVQVLGVLNEFPQVPVECGVQIQLGDAYAQETRRVVFELQVPSLASLGVAKVADLIVRYASVGERIELRELSIPLHVNLVSSDDAALSEADAEVTEEVLVLKAARAQEEARDRADTGDFDGARDLLRSSAEELRRIAPASRQSDELIAQAKAMDESAALMDAGPLSPAANKNLHYQSRQLRQRRRKQGP